MTKKESLRKPLVVVLLLEKRWLDLLSDGNEPNLPYSHDQHLLQFGHEALRRGDAVYFAPIQLIAKAKTFWKVEQIFPRLKVKRVQSTKQIKVTADLLVAVYPQSLSVRNTYPHAKCVGILPAINFLERDDGVSAGWSQGFFSNARSEFDVYLTQNSRMANLANALFLSFARVDLRKRILVCPLGIPPEQTRHFPPRQTIRQQMGLGPNDIAFINAGGPWDWTDYNSFLQAFCNVVERGHTNLKFYIMGFKQTDNNDHLAYIKQTKAIIKKHAHLVGKNLIVFDDWDEASKVVVSYVHAADVGVNANKDTAENWQSYRLRFLEYMKAGLPVINTSGDYLSEHEAKDAVYPAKALDISSYEAAILDAVSDPKKRAQKATAMRACAKTYSSRNTYGKVIDKLVALPKRDMGDAAEVFSPALLQETRVRSTIWDCAPFHAPYVISTTGRVKGKETSCYKIKKDWTSGNGASSQDIHPLMASDVGLCVGFEANITGSAKFSFCEILQMGATSPKARFIAHIEPYDEKFYYLCLLIKGKRNKDFTFVSPKICYRKNVQICFMLLPSQGQCVFWIDGKCYQSEKQKPWTWQSVEKIWIGSSRIAGTVSNAWIGRIPESALSCPAQTKRNKKI